MPEPLEQEFEKALQERGISLATGLGFLFGEYIGDDNLEVAADSTLTCVAGSGPADLPRDGVLLLHRGTLASPRSDSFTLGWFLGAETVQRIVAQAGGEPQLASRLDALALELADQLATDKYSLLHSSGQRSSQLLTDYLDTIDPQSVAWTRFQLQSAGHPDSTIYLAWPRCTLERMFGPPEMQKSPPPRAAAPEPAAAKSTVSPPPQPHPSEGTATIPMPTTRPPKAGIQRLLKTQVPLIVTLASREIPTSRLLDLSPGSIIEFERGCEQPLQLSANNLPIGMGEAVKVGEHFGLKITSIVSPEDRIRRLGGKWKF